MGDLLVRAVARYPDQRALIDNSETVTYRELGVRVSRAAALLRRVGVRRGQGVAQLAGNSITTWVVQAATYIIGARYVGLNPHAGTDDVDFILRDSASEVLIVDQEHAPRVVVASMAVGRVLDQEDVRAAAQQGTDSATEARLVPRGTGW